MRTVFMRYPNASFIRKIEDVIKYNEIAGKVMKKYGIETIDLYRFTLSLGLSGDDLFRDHTTFSRRGYKAAGCIYSRSGKYV